MIGDIRFSGQITVTAAGTEVRGPDVKCPGGVIVRAFASNTGKMYVGNNGDGTVSSSTGYELNASENIYIPIANLNDLLVDSSVNGEKVCWILV